MRVGNNFSYQKKPLHYKNRLECGENELLGTQLLTIWLPGWISTTTTEHLNNIVIANTPRIELTLVRSVNCQSITFYQLKSQPIFISTNAIFKAVIYYYKLMKIKTSHQRMLLSKLTPWIIIFSNLGVIIRRVLKVQFSTERIKKSYPVRWEFPYKMKLMTSEKSWGWNVLLGALLMWLLNAREISWISVWLLLLLTEKSLSSKMF